ncbi:hypothetical protein GGR56DRAFT_634742 [Xylariaceae sp. FL0804]|nr:hypothetical protein GGR56DRAFT_634742 [Xylariaceae sp. FL0804]
MDRGPFLAWLPNLFLSRTSQSEITIASYSCGSSRLRSIQWGCLKMPSPVSRGEDKVNGNDVHPAAETAMSTPRLYCRATAAPLSVSQRHWLRTRRRTRSHSDKCMRADRDFDG